MSRVVYIKEQISIKSLKNYISTEVLKKNDYLFRTEVNESQTAQYSIMSDYNEWQNEDIEIIPVKIKDAQFYVCPIKKDFEKNNLFVLKNKINFINDIDFLNELNDYETEKIQSNVCFVIIYSVEKKFYELFESFINEFINKYYYYLDTFILS